MSILFVVLNLMRKKLQDALKKTICLHKLDILEFFRLFKLEKKLSHQDGYMNSLFKDSSLCFP